MVALLKSVRKTARRYFILGVPHEDACLGVCVAHFCYRYRAAFRNLCPDDGHRADDGPGHLDINRSFDDNEEKEIVEVSPCKEEVEEIILANEFS